LTKENLKVEKYSFFLNQMNQTLMVSIVDLIPAICHNSHPDVKICIAIQNHALKVLSL